ncbi:MAG TPA: hypothetical protein VIN11_02265, partial [Roseivirga sp.]
MNKRVVGIVGIVSVIILASFYVFKTQSDKELEPVFFEEPEQAELEIPEEPQFKYGIPLEIFEIEEGNIKRNQTFADIILPYNISHQDIFT